MDKNKLNISGNPSGSIIVLFIIGMMVYYCSKNWIKRIEVLFLIIPVTVIYYCVTKIIKNFYLQVIIGTILVALFGTAISLDLKHNADLKGSVATAVGVGSALLIGGLIDKYDSKSEISKIGVAGVMAFLISITVIISIF